MDLAAFDVSLSKLEIWDGSSRHEIDNLNEQIEPFLRSRPGWIVVCEPTGRYHLHLVETALRLGHTVYLVNPREAKNYKESLSFRAKTDRLDARYLYEYVKRNRDLLKPYQAPSLAMTELRRQLGVRQSLVEARTALTQSLGKELGPAQRKLLTSFDEAIREVEAQMEAIAKKFDSYNGFRSLPGVGKIAGCALVYVMETKQFGTSGALVAFLGLDIRIRRSGTYKGLEKVTKRGDPLLRFLLCFAGRGLLLSKYGKAKKTQLEAKGRKFPERMVIAARKLLRVAFVIFTQQTVFDPEKWAWD